MSEPTEKKPTEEKKTTAEEKKTTAEEKNSANTVKVNRDQKGRFTSDKKSADGSVKINVVKENKKADAAKSEKGNDKQEPKVKGYILRISSDIPFPVFPEFPEFPRFPSLGMRRLFSTDNRDEEKQPAAPTIKDFAQYVSEKEPDTLTFNDKKYYSEQFVSKIVAETIAQCAQKSAQEEERSKKVAEEQKHMAEAKEELRKKVRNHRIADTLSKVLANLLLGVIVFGLGCTAAFGLLQFCKFLFR